MGALILKNGILAETGMTADIVIQDGIVAEVMAGATMDGGDAIDCGGSTVYPGFIDVHIHGAVGVDVNEADAEGLIEVAKFLASNGVSAWMPTLVPDSDENYKKVIDAIDRLMEIQSALPIAQAVGVHYEGVFANQKMCGALRPEYFKRATPEAVAGLPRLKNGVHMTTLAPEIEGGIELVEGLVEQGWIASIGHTRADVETLELAYAAGARHVTHFFNAMTGIHHRDMGVAGWALTNDAVTFDIIADGVHVHPRMLEFACRRKTPRKTILISDSAAPTGLGNGTFELWGETISVENGRTRNTRGSIAGSVISMFDAVKGMLSIGFTPAEVSMMAATNPARLLGIDGTRGSIAKGKRADIVAFDAMGDLAFIIIGGRLVERS